MFSRSCEYTIKALIYVAQNTKDGKRVSIKEIAKGTDAPEHFVAKILQELSKKKTVMSIKGPNGGFYLEEGGKHVSLERIVKEIDGDGMFTNCVLGLKVCSEKTPCPVHLEYKEVKKNLIRMLENNTISDFNDKLDSGKFFLKNE